MSTIVAKRRKLTNSLKKKKRAEAAQSADLALIDEPKDDRKLIVQFESETGELAGPQIEIPAIVTQDQLQVLCNKLVGNEEESVPYTFFVNEEEVVSTLAKIVLTQNLQPEEVLRIVYQPQAVFRVRAIAQCSATIPGHADNIVELYFSPDGTRLASGSGDKTVRFWDLVTQTPEFTCSGHKHWVQCIAWAADGSALASGGRDNEVHIWDPTNGKELYKPLTGHSQYITWISWEPLHSSPTEKCTRLVSASKDGTARIWDLSKANKLQVTLTTHTKNVTCVKWGGEGMIYTSSQDMTINVWRAADGALCRTLKGHAHWINHIALNTDYVLRTGPYDHLGVSAKENLKEAALERYQKSKGDGPELLISSSEDRTLILWSPLVDKKPITRITGHQQGVAFAQFSPDGRLIASASFDKSAKIWDGKSGKFLGTVRGHVGPVYRLAWSPDSRMLVTASEDSTIKLWDVKSCSLVSDLPGHAGSVFAIDWAPNGEAVASGGADKLLKLWKR